MATHLISNDYLTLDSIEDIFTDRLEVKLSPLSVQQDETCYAYLSSKITNSGKPIYGVNTGFGSLCNVVINPEELSELQYNLIQSHACGIGDQVPDEIVRLMLLLKIQSLSYGHSGVSLETINRLIYFFNEKIHPIVFTLGSLGASGDLAPLAHLCLPLIGGGKVKNGDKEYQTVDFYKSSGMSAIKLGPKEGLALLNGTQFMSAYGVAIILKLKKLIQWSDIIASLSIDAFNCSLEPFHPLLHKLRPHIGQVETASQILSLLSESQIAHQPKTSIQDPYSFRCIPQVHGTLKEIVQNSTETLLTEINSVSDNPNIFTDNELILSGGNFHGQAIAVALDFIAIGMTQVACMSERRIFQLLSGKRGLPNFLIPNPGLHSGLMIAQYTAAAIANEMKHKAHPHSIDSITSCDGQEDFVSMGANAAVKCYQVLGLFQKMLAIELFHASQALSFRKPLKTSPYLEVILNDFRCIVPPIAKDVVVSLEMNKAIKFINEYELTTNP